MSRHLSRRIRRAPILVLLVAAVVAGGLLDRQAGPASTAGAQTVQPVPVAAPADALSSSWFCAGATDGGTVPMPGKVVIANDGAQPVNGQITLVGSSAPPVRVPVSLGAYAGTTIAEAVPGGSQWVGAIVDVDGGSVGVEQVNDGPSGRATTPCATSGSQHWYFPAGQTRVNADEAILLLNPYASDSIVDLSFSTDQGIETPEDFQAIDVPHGSIVGVDLGAHLRRRASIATTVSARTGSVVAFETMWASRPASGTPIVGTPAAAAPLADPALPAAGNSIALGAPSAGLSWVWPAGLAGSGIDEQYAIYNPGAVPAQVRLSVGLDQGSAEPFSLTVAPYQVVPVVSEQSARIPAGVAHSAVLTSVNGVPVVAARTVVAVDAATPHETRNGIGQILGGRLAARDWLVPVGLTDSGHHGHVVIYNPGVDPVRAQIAGLDSAGEPTSVPGGGRTDVVLPDGVGGPFDVRATGPVYVEYDLYGPIGLSLEFAIPLAP